MGTRFEIVIERDGMSAAHVQSVGAAAIAEIERLHRLLSFYASDSLLSHINRHAASGAVRVDADTFALLQDARSVWLLSGGAFDVTRGSGMDAVMLDESARTVSFARAGISIDLGGIAKGHAVDRAAAILREYGIDRALVHGGTSSIAAIGAPLDEERGWHVAVATHDTDDMRTVWLNDTTLSASSGALRPHIIDPATRSFVEGPRIAAVIGPSARLGDAWSTALAVLGRRPATLGPEWTSIIE